MQSIDPMSDLIAPFDEIAMILVDDSVNGGQRPLNERERMARAAAWGYRQAVLDQLSLEGADPSSSVQVFLWFCAQISQSFLKGNIIGYAIQPHSANDNV